VAHLEGGNLNSMRMRMGVKQCAAPVACNKRDVRTTAVWQALRIEYPRL
jgi:hypothetical protein